MKKLVWLLLLYFIIGCTSVPDQVTPVVVGYDKVPVSCDIVAEDNSLKKDEMPSVTIKSEYRGQTGEDTLLNSNNLPEIFITSYTIEYDYVDNTIIGSRMPGFTVDNLYYRIEANESKTFVLSCYDDAQRLHAINIQNLNPSLTFFSTQATITFKGHDSTGSDFELTSAIVINFGNFK